MDLRGIIRPGQLASLIIAGSMSVGVMAILGFCLHVMFNRKFQCGASVEGDSTMTTAGSGNLTTSRRYQPSKIFTVSGRLPPPPPLSPPRPPVDCVVEISHISNTSVTYISESDYESMQEMTSSSEDTTTPYIVFSSELSSHVSSGQPQSEGPRTHELKFGGHLTPTVSVITEEDEDTASWDSRGDRATLRVASDLNLRPLEGVTMSSYLNTIQIPPHVPDSETSLAKAVTAPISQKTLSTSTKSTLHPASATDKRRVMEDHESSEASSKL